MPIDPINYATAPISFPSTQGGGGVKSALEGFSDLLEKQIQETDALQKEAGQASMLAAMGNAGVSLHDAQIAGARADLHLRMLMQVRNKALDLYKEIMSMQV